MPIRTLVVDDEEPARVGFASCSSAIPEVEVIGDAEDGVQAIERITELTPDLVLLDIQMPGCSGLEVAASLGRPRPAIIFCTAYDQYAVDAFELHAVDYLLKPVNRARLRARPSIACASCVRSSAIISSIASRVPRRCHPRAFSRARPRDFESFRDTKSSPSRSARV